MSTTERKPSRRVFLEAARSMAAGEPRSKYCCCELYNAARRIGILTRDERNATECVEENAFHRLFRPATAIKYGPYFGVYFGRTPDEAEARRNRRVLALLLAAEIMRNPEDLP